MRALRELRRKASVCGRPFIDTKLEERASDRLWLLLGAQEFTSLPSSLASAAGPIQRIASCGEYKPKAVQVAVLVQPDVRG
jgi:hypothetical protein